MAPNAPNEAPQNQQSQAPDAQAPAPWHPTACILCENNCGIEVQLGGDDSRQFARIKGDRRHPESKGYVCQKAGRLNHYQNSRDRLLLPQRRREDGSYETVEWDTAIAEVAERLKSVRDEHGGKSIFYYGGGGQGNHLLASYTAATRRVLGSTYRSNALAQEKTGEFWVHSQMIPTGGAARGDFETCEVGVFLGKNPWQSHGIPRARVTLREMAKDPERALVVIDVVRTETADLADYFLQVKPATDAWLLSAMVKILLEEELTASDWLDEHANSVTAVTEAFANCSVAECCEACGVDEELVREVTRRIARARSVSIFEDLGVQMNRNSTLVSYLQRLVWLLTGNYGNDGGHNSITPMVSITGSGRSGKKSPVTGAEIISGLLPCNTVPDEILSDHPDRFRAMIVDSANPVHSLAQSSRWREAMKALDFTVVVDVAMTETARCADYVLPAATQYEKAECTFFNFGFPHNCFHLRSPLLEPPAGPLPEPEIQSRLTEALGALPQEPVDALRKALEEGGRPAFGAEFARLTSEDPRLLGVASVLLYRTLGPTLPKGLESAASLWAISHQVAQRHPESLRRAGIEGEGLALGENLFDKILESRSGLVFAEDTTADSWARIRNDDRKVELAIPVLLDELASVLEQGPVQAANEFPFFLSAGERRSFTANTIYRDPNWRRRDFEGALRMSPLDAETLGVETGSRVRIRTRHGQAVALLEVNDRMQPGHISLPNGTGLDYPDESGERTGYGVSPNELTSLDDRDFLAGTPWHKSVPAQVEPA